MKNEYPNHLLKGILYLDSLNIEEKLAPVNLNVTLNFTSQHFFDLSQVRFVDLNAVAQLLLIIESNLKKYSTIYIALPTIGLVDKEKESKSYSKELKQVITLARRKSNSFLKTVGFVKAIREISTIYNREIYVSETYNFEKDFNIEPFRVAFETIFETSETEYNNYRYVFPFEWINCNSQKNLFNDIEKRLDAILENSERGLDPIDVKGIKNVIFSELTKNVREHSSSDYALFTVGLIKSSTLYIQNNSKKPNPIESDYVAWLKASNIPSQIEIYFGDSGTGILSNAYSEKYRNNSQGEILNDEERLKLAFQKWTTLKNNEKRRGTKGLYRIQRIVNKYNGLFHITTGRLNGGFQKGGLQEEEWKCRKSKLDFKGTFIQIKLCPYSDIKEFRYVLRSNNSTKRWKTVQYRPKQLPTFLESFKLDVKANDNLLIILNIVDHNDHEGVFLLESNLKEFSFYSHPCAVVLYILSNLKNDTIQTIVESVNTEIINEIGNEIFQETSHWDAEEVYDPVLVIGDNNETFWYGGNQNLINLLNESHKKYKLKPKLSELNEYKQLEPDLKNRIRLHLENDNKLVNVNKDEHFNFNFTNIDKFFESEIVKKIDNLEKHETPFCTPKLEVVENWLNIRDLIGNNEYGYALTLYLKYREYLGEGIYNLNRNTLFILIDHMQQKELAKAFTSLLGVKLKNIKNIYEDINTEVPKRTKLFPENSVVIILTTIISSSETIRRLVKYVKRDSANSNVILCLCNYRKYNISKLETWEEETKIVSLFQKNQKKLDKPEQDQQRYQKKRQELFEKLVLKSPLFETEKSSDIYTINEDIKNHIIDNKLLHYNHVGIYKDRHFTFYLDKIRLLDVKSFIWVKIKDAIDHWKVNNKITEYTLYISRTILALNLSKSHFLEFARSLTKSVKIVNELNYKIDDINVIYLDFGMMTGKAVNNVINQCSQVGNLFICILFNQIKNNDFQFYQRINSLNNADNFTRINNIVTDFKIQYLFDLPLSYFNSENCPICEHKKALENYKINNDYLTKFSEDRQQKLEITEAEEIQFAEYPFDFYYSTDDIQHELSSEIIMKMYELKVLIEKAEHSTQQRIYVYDYIYDVYTRFDSYINESNSQLYAILYFLSHEINWLQKEPLVFRDFRGMLANIAYKIAIIDRVKLANLLERTNNYQTTADKLSVRYKYASISLLRSTNKLLFCQSISKVILSSRIGDVLSNNIVQNTMYHIVSLFKNKYNRSRKYFENIQVGLRELSNNGLSLKIYQKLAIQKIDLMNQTKLKDIDFKGIDLEHIYIKSMQKELIDVYEEHHPKPIEFFHKIYLKRYMSIFNEYDKVKEKARNFSTLLAVKTKLVAYWKSTLEFLNNSVFFYLDRLDHIRNSQFFRNNFSNSLNIQEYYQTTDRFTELVYLIEEDLNNYNLYNQEYDLLWDKINTSFIRSKGQQGETQNSKVLNLTSYFPTNLLESINNVFPLSIFPNRKTFGNFDLNVFYPNNEFLIHLDLVKNNIEVKKNSYVDLRDIDIQFIIERYGETKVALVIRYDSTEQFSKPESKNGSLSNWRKEVDFFQATLSYELPINDNKYFSLQIKLLKYE